jgi:hypothetical protein
MSAGSVLMRRRRSLLLWAWSKGKEDIIYPTTFRDGDGNPRDGGYNYVIHFDKAFVHSETESGLAQCTERILRAYFAWIIY